MSAFLPATIDTFALLLEHAMKLLYKFTMISPPFLFYKRKQFMFSQIKISHMTLHVFTGKMQVVAPIYTFWRLMFLETMSNVVSHQQQQQVVRHIANIITDSIGRRVTENNWSGCMF